MQNIAKVHDGQLIASGIFPSLAPDQDALWRDGENIDFIEGSVEKSRGATSEFMVPEPANALAQAHVEGEKRVYVGSETGLRLWRGAGVQVLRTGLQSGRWSMEVFGDQLVATNDKDPIQHWPNTGLAAAIAGTAGVVQRAKIVRKLNNYLVIANTDNSGQEVRWASQGTFNQWEPTEDNSAGGYTIQDLDGDITAMEPVRKVLAFYSEDSIGVMTPVSKAGGSFTFDVPINGAGAVGMNAVVSKGIEQFGLSRKGFFRTDLMSFTPIDTPAVRRYLESTIDWTKGEEVVGLHNERREQIEWYYTDLDGNRRGLVYSYKSNAWSKRRANVLAAAEQQVFQFPLIGSPTSVGYYGYGLNFQGASVDATLKSGFISGPDRTIYKQWDRLVLDMQKTSAMTIRFGFADEPKDEEVEWWPWVDLERENWISLNGKFRESVFLQFEIRSNVIGGDFRLGGLDLYGEPGGPV